jgi:hypothetical protein
MRDGRMEEWGDRDMAIAGMAIWRDGRLEGWEDEGMGRRDWRL